MLLPPPVLVLLVMRTVFFGVMGLDIDDDEVGVDVLASAASTSVPSSAMIARLAIIILVMFDGRRQRRA